MGDGRTDDHNSSACAFVSGEPNIVDLCRLKVLILIAITFIGPYIRVFVLFFGLVCCFTSQSKAMVISGKTVHLTTLFPGRA